MTETNGHSHTNGNNELPLLKCRDLKENGLTGEIESWHGSSFVSVSQLSPCGLALLCQKAREMKHLVQQGPGGNDALKHNVVATVFYEASTRTACSFQAATQRLGGNIVHVDATSSSVKKGESLSDTIRCLACYTDAVILRHYQEGSCRAVALDSDKPLLNAGDGVGEHPTQALLDFYTIWQELDLPLSTSTSLNDDDDNHHSNATTNQKPLIVTMLGDLKHGRTVHSLAKLLATKATHVLGSNNNNNKMPIVLRYCSPASLEMPQDLQDEIQPHLHAQETIELSQLPKALEDSDILYVTRLQKERLSENDNAASIAKYIVTPELLQHAPPSLRVLHPLPRVDEISTKVDRDVKRAAYFRQMENGMYVRMALLALILGKV